MTKQDFSNVNLIDVGFGTYSYWSFYNKFLKLGINTVAQILDDELMDDVIRHTRKQEIRDEIRGFIDLIKSEFIGKELTITPLLDEPASKLIIRSNQDNPVNFGRMGFRICSSPNEIAQLEHMYYRYLRAYPENNTNAKIIDVFRYAFDNMTINDELYKKIKIMINSYDHVIDNNVSLEILKHDVEELKKERSELDKKIRHLEEQIVAISGGLVR